MANEFADLAEGLGQFGQMFEAIFKNEYAVYFIVLFILALMINSLLKKLLSKIPIFEGDGDREVNKSGNVISWCISILCIISLGWSTKNQGPGSIVNAFAGPWGSFLIIILAFLAGYSTYKSTENCRPVVQKACSFAAAAFVISYLGSFLLGYDKSIGVTATIGADIGIAIFVGFLIIIGGMFMNKRST